MESNLNFRNLNISLNQQKMSVDLQNSMIKLQHLMKQVTLFNFIIEKSQILQYEPQLNKIQTSPKKIYSKLSTNINEIFTQWLHDLLSKPKLFACAAVNYFESNPNNLNLFAHSTFPSMFYNFISKEFQKKAYDFVKEIVKKRSKNNPNLSDLFLSSFINSNLIFSQYFWNEFFFYINNNQVDNTISKIFDVFLSSLKASFACLSKYQHKLLVFYAKHSRKNFIIFLANLLNWTLNTDLYTKGKSAQLLQNLFDFMKSNEKSPHVSLVIKALDEVQYHKWFGSQIETQSETRTATLILTLHDCFLIQQFVFANPDLVTIKIIQSLKVPSEFENDFECVSLQVSTKTLFWNDHMKTIDNINSNQQPNNVISQNRRIQSNEFDNYLFFIPDQIPIPKNNIEDDPRYNLFLKITNKFFISPDKILSEKTPEITRTIQMIPKLMEPSFIDIVKENERINNLISIQNYEKYITKLMIEKHIQNFAKKIQVILTIQRRFIAFMLNDQSEMQKIQKRNSYHSKDSHDNIERMFFSSNFYPDYDLFKPQIEAQNTTDTPSDILLKNPKKTKRKFTFKRPKNHHNKPIHFKRKTSFDDTKQNNELTRARARAIDAFSYNLSPEANVSSLNHIIGDYFKNYSNDKMKFWLIIAKLNKVHYIDKTIQNLQQKYIEEISGIRVAKLFKHKKHWQNSKYLKICAHKIDSLKFSPQGTSFVEIILLGKDIISLTSSMSDPKTKSFQKNGFKIFERVLLLSSNDSIFETFLFIEQFMRAGPEIKMLLSEKQIDAINFMKQNFFRLLRSIDVLLMEQTMKAIENNTKLL